MDILFGVFNSITSVINHTWWIILPVFLFPLFWNLRIIYLRTRFINGIEWTMLEIKIPKEIFKTPKAMEQIFAGAYASYSYGMNYISKYFEGKVEPWFSFELVGSNGGVYFYIRTPSKYRNLIESAIYAQYPEAEIHQAEDYLDLLPSILPNKIYDVFGTDLILAKENYYPIKTYTYFEEPVDERRLDSIAAITEVMSNLKTDEWLLLHILISPTGALTGNDWQKEGQDKINELSGKKTEKGKKGWGGALYNWMRNLSFAPVKYPDWPGQKEKEAATMKFLNPYEQDVVKALGAKISKLGFEIILRLVYLDRQDSFTPANFSAAMGALHQLNTANLNAFKPHPFLKSWTIDNWFTKIFPRYKLSKELYRKRRIFKYCQQRRFGQYNKTRPEKFSILSTEELATVYHFPAIPVKAPRLRTVEAKKGGPPAGLPVE